MSVEPLSSISDRIIFSELFGRKKRVFSFFIYFLRLFPFL